MIETKRPKPYQSRLDTWRAQALAQFLGVNYIVFRCVKQQSIGSGIPVLLTSFQDGEAILFSGQPKQGQDGISQVRFDTIGDALAMFKARVDTRQAAAVQVVSVADLMDAAAPSAPSTTSCDQAGELAAGPQCS